MASSNIGDHVPGKIRCFPGRDNTPEKEKPHSNLYKELDKIKDAVLYQCTMPEPLLDTAESVVLGGGHVAASSARPLNTFTYDILQRYSLPIQPSPKMSAKYLFRDYIMFDDVKCLPSYLASSVIVCPGLPPSIVNVLPAHALKRIAAHHNLKFTTRTSVFDLRTKILGVNIDSVSFVLVFEAKDKKKKVVSRLPIPRIRFKSKKHLINPTAKTVPQIYVFHILYRNELRNKIKFSTYCAPSF